MTDSPINEDNPQATGEPESTPPPSGEDKQPDHMIPKKRFDQVNTRMKEAEARLKELEAREQEATAQAQEFERKQLEEQQKWQELANNYRTELEALQGIQQQAESYKASLNATNESRIARIPESKRYLVDGIDDPVQLGAFLDKIMSDPDIMGTQPSPQPPRTDGGSGQVGTHTGRDAFDAKTESAIDRATRLGYTPNRERIARLKKQQG